MNIVRCKLNMTDQDKTLIRVNYKHRTVIQNWTVVFAQVSIPPLTHIYYVKLIFIITQQHNSGVRYLDLLHGVCEADSVTDYFMFYSHTMEGQT